MGFIHLITRVSDSGDNLDCEVNIACDANVVEVMGAAAALLVEAESRVPVKDRARFRTGFLEALNNRRKAAKL